ncbi:UNVERIFIED_CONTAM: putative amidohydrolase YtcJ [Brevibacillus sp. OAP136]
MNEKADIVLSSQAVFTGLLDEPHPASIAIKGNRIVAIGSEEQILPYINEHTKVYSFGNQLIMPGFHDFHLHMMFAGLTLDSVNLHAARSEEEAALMVYDYAKSRPDEQWIIGMQWDFSFWQNKRLPRRETLDRLLPDRPVILFHTDGHIAWVNSKALEMADLDENTPAPSYGSLEKGQHGELTGVLYENAIALITDKAYKFSRYKKLQIIATFFRLASSMGITSIHDMYAPFDETLQDPGLLKELDETDSLPLRIYLTCAFQGNLESARSMQREYRSEKLRFAGLKGFIDGVVMGYTAYMLEPYTDHPETRGEPSFEPETLKQWVVAADRAGFSIRFHAIGDAAVRLALDAFEEARKTNGDKDTRHAIEHIEVIHPDDIARFHTCKVIASMQPSHLAMCEREAFTARIGMERAEHVFPINRLKVAGATLAFGTDFPIAVSLNPLLQIYAAVTRIDNSGQPDRVWNPDDRITLAEALRAYTNGPAYGSFREHELGTLAEGKLADLVVLDRNLFDGPADELLHAKVRLTMVDGRIEYEG